MEEEPIGEASGSRWCFVVPRHALRWICNEHPASDVGLTRVTPRVSASFDGPPSKL
jgi:hypothetical protein